MNQTAKCPYCLEDFDLKDGVFPYHDYPKPCRRICSGANKTPVEACSEFEDWLVVYAQESGLIRP